ncbi:MAG: 2-oxoacid:ferredoxin oxidoreductase subunit gamma [Clostridiales bacterium]|jgi:2-oxoglutarate ferredoxin oxidoreductase subunit gamma|nr:2-oxoacid:ferredoxin oxidoreductase subunit gamma [Clostridiales bacterium]
MEMYEVRLSGSGGQGLITGGIILAEAAILDGKNAVQTQSYGPEARGGASKAEVIISTEKIDFPKIRDCDIFLSLTQKSFDQYGKNVKDNGIIIVDESIDTKSENKVIYSLPILDTAHNVLGKPMVTNIVALGVIAAITNVVSRNALEEAVLNRVPKGTEDLNKKALEMGYSIGKKAIK